MSEHICVIGANSFSGAHFVKKALERGCRVSGVSRSEEPDPVFLPWKNLPQHIIRHYDFSQLDINRNLDALMEKLEREKPAYIVNFAAQGMVAESWHAPCQWLRTNALSPLALLNFLREKTWLRKFVQISTPEVYGSTSGTIKESFFYNPSTPYAVSKACADMNLKAYFQAFGFPVVFTRAANVYGPGQRLYRIIPKAILQFLTGEKLELHGGGSAVRSFIHIDDVCDATLKIMLDGKAGEVFHISGPDVVSIRDLARKIAAIMNVDPDSAIVAVGERLGKDSHYLLDSSKLEHELHWKPRHTLDSGIREVISWIRGNFVALAKMPRNYQHKE